MRQDGPERAKVGEGGNRSERAREGEEGEGLRCTRQGRVAGGMRERADSERSLGGGGGGRHRMTRDVSDVTAVSASPMAVAPSGPRLLALKGGKGGR